jgi:hypothetical protein
LFVEFKGLMTRPPNPITQGLRAVWQDPFIFLLEILWRWSFALLGGLLLFAAGLMLFGSLPVGPYWSSAWSSHDPGKMGATILTILLLLGIKAVIAAIAVPIMLALLWGILSGLGRWVTVKRLRSGMSLRLGAMFALQFLRAFLTWISAVLLIAAVIGEALIATRGPRPDLALYYLLVMPSVLLIGIFWLVLNWRLTLAAVFGQEEQSFGSAFRQARQIVRRQRSDFAGTGFVFLLFRAVVLMVAVAICGLTSGMVGSSPQTYFTLATVVAVAYFAASDYLYMARMAAYLALTAAHEEPRGPKLVTTSAALPFENSPSR